MAQCSYCGSESSYESVIIACEEDCEREAKNTREWFANYNPHRKD